MSDQDPDQSRAFADTHAPGAGDQARAIATVEPMPGVADADDQRLDGLLPIGVSPLAATGPGRPKGAKNRRTDLVATYLVERFGDPLSASMAVAGRPLKDLITELRTVASDCGLKLGATVMDIARFQRDCRNDALPYIHAKRAPETIKGDVVVPIIGIGRYEQHNTVVHAHGRTIEDVLDAVANKPQLDQQLNEPAADVSHGGKSHDEPTD